MCSILHNARVLSVTRFSLTANTNLCRLGDKNVMQVPALWIQLESSLVTLNMVSLLFVFHSAER